MSRAFATPRRPEKVRRVILGSYSQEYRRPALPAVAQRGGQTTHRQQDPALDEFVVVAGAVPTQQLNLEVVQRLEVGEPVEHRAGQRGVGGEQGVVAGGQPV